MHTTKLFFLAIFTVFSIAIKAQDYNEIFKTDRTINPEDSNKLYFRFENLNFFKNNEYFGNNEEGLTDLGMLLKPKLVYYPSKNTKLEAGVHLLKFSGKDNYTQKYPIFSFQVEICKGLSVLLGSLYSGYNHELIEPLYKSERHFEKNYENGIQITTNLTRFKSDLWIDWEKFIFNNEPYKEEFTVGTTNKIFLTNPEADFKVSVPVQAMISHKGGQIDTDTLHPLQTVFDGGGGLSLEYKFKSKWINSVGFNSYFLQYADTSQSRDFANDSIKKYYLGLGSYSNFWINTKYVNFSIGYWYGNFFIAPRGEELFQSISYRTDSKAGIRTPINQILFTKIGFKKEVCKDVFVELRFEGYYELLGKDSYFDYSYGLHIVFNRNFFMRKM